MNKVEFINYIAERNGCTKVEAERVINRFTDSVIGAMSEGREVSLAGFGHFTSNKIPARAGRNPKNGNPIEIPAHTQPKFRAGQKLKDGCNK